MLLLYFQKGQFLIDMAVSCNTKKITQNEHRKQKMFKTKIH